MVENEANRKCFLPIVGPRLSPAKIKPAQKCLKGKNVTRPHVPHAFVSLCARRLTACLRNDKIFEKYVFLKVRNPKMLAKVTSRNQVTIPKKIMNQLPPTSYFEVELKNGVVLLKPVAVYETDLDTIRSKMKQLGLKPDSVREAVKWARGK